MSNRHSAIRARILAISSRITRLLVGKTDPVEIRAIIDDGKAAKGLSRRLGQKPINPPVRFYRFQVKMRFA
jgi:hypothetical protein